MDYAKDLEDIVNQVIKEGASDLHLAEGRAPIVRISGNLLPLLRHPVVTAQAIHGYINVLLGDENKKILEASKDVDFSYSVGNTARFRGNVYFRQGKLSIALRLISSKIRNFDE